MAWLAEDISTSGATTRTSPNFCAVSASSQIPGLYTPSSLAIKMRMKPPVSYRPVWLLHYRHTLIHRKDARIVRVILLHNEGAGDDNQPDGKALRKLLRDAGHDVEYCDARDETWAAALEKPADVVAVAGGDGTVGRVAKKLIGRDIPVAPLPFGTANNISKTLGLTELSLKE